MNVLLQHGQVVRHGKSLESRHEDLAIHPLFVYTVEIFRHGWSGSQSRTAGNKDKCKDTWIEEKRWHKILRGNPIWEKSRRKKRIHYFQVITLNSTELILCLQSQILINFCLKWLGMDSLFRLLSASFRLLFQVQSQCINTLRVIIDGADHANFRNCAMSTLDFFVTTRIMPLIDVRDLYFLL